MVHAARSLLHVLTEKARLAQVHLVHDTEILPDVEDFCLFLAFS